MPLAAQCPQQELAMHSTLTGPGPGQDLAAVAGSGLGQELAEQAAVVSQLLQELLVPAQAVGQGQPWHSPRTGVSQGLVPFPAGCHPAVEQGLGCRCP